MSKKNFIKEPAVINMVVNDDSGFLSKFSTHKTSVISPEVADFLENSAQRFSPKQRLHLQIEGDCVSENEKESYALAIKEYFSDEMAAIGRELRHYNMVAAILMAIGIVILAASIIFPERLWAAVLDIIAWVFIWEAVDIIAFRKRELRIRKFRCRAFVNMKIEYL
ncbi:MAG: hypothetical protein Q4B65_00860 [Candidatus Saccharibacteria bacterium]|nr:hypothetical protein [Candidatus Saccharibacteria bacterium]